MLAGEFDALLLTVTLLVAAPLAEGANVEVSVVICPGERVSPFEDVELNPAPATSTCEMVTSELPAFVRIMCCVLLLDILTLPKFKLLVLELSTSVPVFETVVQMRAG
jgi:hypothetical protein